ncbi:replication protein P [Pantoea sp. GM01]|uniref:replication protein P n=1 Tax=Pantoea sp. GM01 TaxID=1144320 RepID=UPI000271440F|nr:replication protein P [Pantoea sp. GM01]EJL80964.1 Replication protein P [Pantoea sp. GM01]
MNRDLFDAVQNRNGVALASMANQGQPTGDNVVNLEAARLVDKLFNQLKLVFPAAEQTALKSDAHETAAKRQWTAAFAEGGIRTLEQLSAGMRHARASTSPFWPSPGQFVSWCKDSTTVLGVSLEEAMDEFRRYNRDKGQYTTPEAFSWSKPIMYWLVTEARRAMYQRCMTEPEVENFMSRKMAEWSKKVAAGEQVPNPVQTLDKPIPVQTEQHSFTEAHEHRSMPNAAYLGSVTPAQWLYEEYKRRKASGMKV